MINRIALVLAFGLFVLTAAAQEKTPSKNCHQNTPTQISDPQTHTVSNQLPAPPVPPDPPPPPDMRGMDDHRPILNLPGLTDDQKTAIKKVDIAFMPQVTPLRKLIEADKAKLEALLAMHPPDVTQTDNTADEIGKTVSKLLKTMVQYDQSLRVTLSPEQQVIFDARPKPWLRERP